MKTSELIEANANLVKWCVHVLGPDEIHAAPDHHAAVIAARDFNQHLYSRHPDKLDEILLFAHPAPWPHSDKHHSENLAGWEVFCGLKVDPNK